MTISDDVRARPWSNRARWLLTPTGALAVLLIAAAALRCIPARITDPMRDAWMTLLRPAAAVTNDVIEFSQGRVLWLQAALADGQRAAEAERQVADLKEQNDRLAMALDASRLTHAQSESIAASASPTQPLLESQAIAARVLGHAAQTFLRGSELVDIGNRNGVAAGALVIDGAPPGDGTTTMIDAGRDLGLQSGRTVLAGRRVWGKLAKVGSHTSVVRRITDPGYHDTVQLAHSDGGPDSPQQLGPRGVLVGSGERLCRIELVDASEPVSVGDQVYTQSDGLLPEPLVYGQIVRVELTADKLHWQIWMQPAVGANEPREVAILRAELNPARMGTVSGE
jgi:cell shape-determining protein MreC